MSKSKRKPARVVWLVWLANEGVFAPFRGPYRTRAEAERASCGFGLAEDGAPLARSCGPYTLAERSREQ